VSASLALFLLAWTSAATGLAVAISRGAAPGEWHHVVDVVAGLLVALGLVLARESGERS
jgi:hypothetical protein